MDVAVGVGAALFYIAIIVIYILVWVFSMGLFIDACRAKGYPMKKNGILWFIGLFGTPIIVGLYANALPLAKDSTPVEEDE